MRQWEREWNDYYTILELSRDANAKQIKKAYHKAAKKYHPDVGGDEEKFKQINEAYEILGVSTEKDMYDRSYDERIKQGNPVHEGSGNGWNTSSNSGTSDANKETTNTDDSEFNEQFYAEAAVCKEEICNYIDEYKPIFDSAINEVDKKRQDFEYEDIDADFKELDEALTLYIKDLDYYLEKAQYYGLASEYNKLQKIINQTNKKMVELRKKIKWRHDIIRINKLSSDLNNIFAEFDKFLEKVYEDLVDEKSYFSYYDRLKQAVNHCINEIDKFSNMNWDDDFKLELVGIINNKRDIISQFAEIPTSLDQAFQSVFVGDARKIYGRNGGSWYGKNVDTYYGMHFTRDTSFDSAYKFIKCTFASNCDFIFGSSFRNCTFGNNIVIGTFYIPNRESHYYGYEVKNSTIFNCKFGNNVSFGAVISVGDGIKVKNTVFGDNCRLGHNNEFVGCTFGSDCHASKVDPASVIIDGIRREFVESNVNQNWQNQNNFESKYIYDPYNDPDNEYRNDLYVIRNGWIIWNGSMDTIIIHPGQRFIIGKHTLEITDDGILVDGSVPAINCKVLDIEYGNLYGKDVMDFHYYRIKFRNGKILDFKGETVFYIELDLGYEMRQAIDPSPNSFNPFEKKDSEESKKNNRGFI